MSRWDSMTPEQQRAIGEAAVKLDSLVGPCNFPTVFGDTGTMRALGDLRDAVRAAECPTWSAEGHCVLRNGVGRFWFDGIETGASGEDLARIFAAALNAHEREKRGLK